MDLISVNGVNVFPFQTKQQLISYIESNKKILIAINAEKILHSTEVTKSIINKNIGYCDGIGALYAVHKKGAKNAIRIPGCELWLNLIQHFHATKTFYLIGGTQAVIEMTIKKLRDDYPGINIIGYRNGYIKCNEEKTSLIQDIINKKPDIVFVAMGSPKQELLMNEMQRMHTAIYQGLGGSFDVYVGKVKRAPEWWIRHNLEGLYRPLVSFSIYKIKRLLKALPFWWNVLLNRY